MSDYSDKYSTEKKTNIFIGRAEKIIYFKPFLKSFSYDIKYGKVAQSDSVYTPVDLKDEFEEASYKFVIDVVANNVNEAVENHSKYQKLLRMIMPVGDSSLESPFLYVKFSNLIHMNHATSYRNLSFSKLKEVGQRGTIGKLDYKPDINMGFFEFDGLIFAKAFSLNVDLLISNETDAGTNEIELEGENIIHGLRSGFKYGRSSTAPIKEESSEDPPITPQPSEPESTTPETRTEEVEQRIRIGRDAFRP